MTDPMDTITNSIMNNINGANKKVIKYTDYKPRPKQESSDNRRYNPHQSPDNHRYTPHQSSNNHRYTPQNTRSYNQQYPQSTYPSKYRTGVDFRGLDWSKISMNTQGLDKGSKPIWKINDSKFSKKVNVSFDEMVRRYSLYVHKLNKNGGGYKNFDDYAILKKKNLDTQINKILVMNGDDDAESKWEMLNNEFVLEVKAEGDLVEDALDWKVDTVKSLNKEDETLFTFSNEIYCALVFKIFGKDWGLKNIDMYDAKLSNYEISEADNINNKKSTCTINYKDKTYFVYEKLSKEMIKNDITKNNTFFKFNSKYKTLKPTKILVLLNMVSLYDLKNEEKFSKIQNSLSSQKQNLLKGATNIIIPRPGIDMIFNDSDEYYKNGLTKIFIEFETVEDSTTAFENLDDWYFQDRKVLLSFYNEIDFQRGIYI
ncbi:hypothetical protein FOG51_04000 [Hanseniaspora uvarum]|nr:hypothetical protein FOG51_04000 [Hanseniaspora uvarum]KAF0276997.1 hypothetical protein FOG50_02187 [Hanseniaspora uvarum]KKA02624.1 Splicing factor HuMUD2 [Hanseniaspora uvarum DSM 2768]